MAHFGKKKTVTEYLYSRLAVFLMGVLLVFLAMSVYERFIIERQMHARRLQTETEKRDLIERKKQLEERVDYLSGERGIEEEIRTHFDVAKEGEQVIILMGEDVDPETTQIEVQSPKKWYQFWE